MVAILLFVIFGIGFALFATLNTATTSVSLGFATYQNVPLFLALLIAFGLGLAFGSIFYFTKSISSKFSSRKRKNELKEAQKEMLELNKKIHKLELENAKLKGEDPEGEFDEESL